MTTLRDLEEMLKSVPDSVKDTEFAVFDNVTGTRIMFPDGLSQLRIAGSFGRALLELQGSQDVSQRTISPPFPGK